MQGIKFWNALRRNLVEHFIGCLRTFKPASGMEHMCVIQESLYVSKGGSAQEQELITIIETEWLLYHTAADTT